MKEGNRERCRTFIMTSVSVSTSRMVSSYSTNVGNTWRPAASHKQTREVKSRCTNVQRSHKADSSLILTNRGEEDDGEEISDWLYAAHDLRCDHVTLRGQQSSSHETA